MNKMRDFTGNNIGDWIVISATSSRSSEGCIKWLCECRDCGRKKFISTASLRNPPNCINPKWDHEIWYLSFRYGISEKTAKAWISKGAPFFDDIEMGKWANNFRDGNRYPHEIRKQVMDAYESGRGIKRIAKRLNIPRTTVRSFLLNQPNYVRNGRPKTFLGKIPVFGSSISKSRVTRTRRIKATRAFRDLPLFIIRNRPSTPKERLITARRYRERYNNNTAFRIQEVLRRRLRKVAKRGRGYSGNHLSWLGCTPEEFRIHLEKQFTNGMSWGNYGGRPSPGRWSIDHIIPCAAFDLTNEEEALRCFHYTNARPLWSLDNISKGGSLPETLTTEVP